MSAADPRWLDRADGPHAWREAGTGAPVVFLHGLGGTRGSWNPQIEALADRFRCIAWDMPGYGAAAPLDPLSYAGVADRLVGLLDHLGLDRVDLVGLSFGGMHALHTTLAHPDRVRRMVLCSTSPAFGMDGTDPAEWKASRLEAIDTGATPADLAEPVLDAIAGRPLDPGIRADLIDAFARIPTDGFRAAVECLPTNDVRGRLHEIPHPTAVVVGAHDTETPVAYAQVLADGLPHAELTILPGIGHLSPSEDPAAVNAVIADHLERP